MPKLRTRPALLLVAFLFCTVIASSAQSTFFTSLASFNGTDGANPYFMSLVQGTDGNFYGTTWLGGNNNCDDGHETCGTVFKITPAGTLTMLYRFCSQADCADGWSPYSGLVQGSDGNFYGTTVYGGNNNCYLGCGTIFKITPAGTLTNAVQLRRLAGYLPFRPPSARQRRELLRDNDVGRGLRGRHGLQGYPRGHAKPNAAQTSTARTARGRWPE